MKISDINFNNRAELRKIIIKLYERCTDRTPNFIMQDRLIEAVLDDHQFTHEENFKILKNALEVFAEYQDHPGKRTFAYLKAIIKGMKLDKKKNIEKDRKTTEAVEAHKNRLDSAKIEKEKKAKEIIEVAGMLKNNRDKFNSDQYKLIEVMITNGNFLSARMRIEEKLEVKR